RLLSPQAVRLEPPCPRPADARRRQRGRLPVAQAVGGGGGRCELDTATAPSGRLAAPGLYLRGDRGAQRPHQAGRAERVLPGCQEAGEGVAHVPLPWPRPSVPRGGASRHEGVRRARRPPPVRWRGAREGRARTRKTGLSWLKTLETSSSSAQ